MKIMHKYALSIDSPSCEIELPMEAVVKHIEYLNVDKTLYVWVEVPADLKSEKQLRRFKVFKTGDGIPATALYIGTAIDHYLPEAYHVYQLDN